MILRAVPLAVSFKRVHRLWKRESLRADETGNDDVWGQSADGCTRGRAEHVKHIHRYDFVST